VLLEVRPGADQLCQALIVIAMHPIAQCLRVHAAKLARLLKSNTSKTRTHFLFRQGCMPYNLIPNMPDHRLIPLMDAYPRAVSAASEFSGLFAEAI
jgi:hypothetical protein